MSSGEFEMAEEWKYFIYRGLGRSWSVFPSHTPGDDLTGSAEPPPTSHISTYRTYKIWGRIWLGQETGEVVWHANIGHVRFVEMWSRQDSDLPFLCHEGGKRRDLSQPPLLPFPKLGLQLNPVTSGNCTPDSDK